MRGSYCTLLLPVLLLFLLCSSSCINSTSSNKSFIKHWNKMEKSITSKNNHDNQLISIKNLWQTLRYWWVVDRFLQACTASIVRCFYLVGWHSFSRSTAKITPYKSTCHTRHLLGTTKCAWKALSLMQTMQVLKSKASTSMMLRTCPSFTQVHLHCAFFCEPGIALGCSPYRALG